MRTSSPIHERDPEGYGPWMLGVVLLLAALSAARLEAGWHGDFEDWLALAVLVAALVGGARLFRRLL
jgi:hypothetical protein